MSLTISTEQEYFLAISLKGNLVVANSEIIFLAVASEITEFGWLSPFALGAPSNPSPPRVSLYPSS